MIPGSVSKLAQVTVASAATILPKGEYVRATGTTGINTIVPPLGYNMSQLLFLHPVDGSIVLGTSGNILVGITAVINRVVPLFWSAKDQKWVICSGV